VASVERVYTLEAQAAHHRQWNGLKRTFDVASAALALLVLLPLLILIALAIKLDSRGPLLFRQRRYGRGMRPFTVLKFRTMHDGVTADSRRRYIARLAAGEDEATGLKKLVDDPRVTRVGRVLRRFSLDELPQFANVLGGSMSLIGPRPAIAYELDHYLPRHYERFAVRPGLSGLWQVSGRNAVGFNEMLDLDVEYARTCSFSTDLRVLLRTPLAMVRGAA
jgi:lipopolysaccharide/colanic/teichoic acid biosynthesis glycosyltransferase